MDPALTPEQKEALERFEAARQRFHARRVRVELDLTDAQITQLRELMDNLPLNPYGPLVVAVLKALPFEPDVGHPSPWDDVPGERDAYLAGDRREISTESTVGTVDPAAAASSRSSACGGGFVLRALSERGRQAMPALESGLLAAGIPWTRGEV